MSKDPTFGMGSYYDSHVPKKFTEVFYDEIISKVMDNTRQMFLSNGVSEKIHEKLRKVSQLLSVGIYASF
jgi:hypothetical protein